jgi:hypothetical protein
MRLALSLFRCASDGSSFAEITQKSVLLHGPLRTSALLCYFFSRQIILRSALSESFADRQNLESSAKSKQNQREECSTPAKNYLARIDCISAKTPFTDRVSFWLRSETLGTEGALWFLLDVIITAVGNRFVGWIRPQERPGTRSWYTPQGMPRSSIGVFLRRYVLEWRPPATVSGFSSC